MSLVLSKFELIFKGKGMGKEERNSFNNPNNPKDITVGETFRVTQQQIDSGHCLDT